MPDTNVPDPQNVPAPQGAPAEGQSKEPEFIAGKFKTQEEFVKSYNELETQLGKMGGELGTLKATSNTNSILMDALYSDPDIQKIIVDKYGGNPIQTPQPQQQAPTQQPPTQPQPQPQQPVADPKIAEMERAMRIDAVKGFDSRFGVDNLKEEEVADVHDKVGKELYALGYNIKTMPVDLIPSMMEKAYKLAFPDKALETAKQEGAAQAMVNMQGQVPSQGGGQIKEDATNLTPQQQDWNKKLGVPDENVKKVLTDPNKAQ